jgi:hypothetical protein
MNNVKKLKTNSSYSTDLIMLLSLQQVIDGLVEKHGSHLVLAQIPTMIQDAQQRVNAKKGIKKHG